MPPPTDDDDTSSRGRSRDVLTLDDVVLVVVGFVDAATATVDNDDVGLRCIIESFSDFDFVGKYCCCCCCCMLVVIVDVDVIALRK